MEAIPRFMLESCSQSLTLKRKRILTTPSSALKPARALLDSDAREELVLDISYMSLNFMVFEIPTSNFSVLQLRWRLPILFFSSVDVLTVPDPDLVNVDFDQTVVINYLLKRFSNYRTPRRWEDGIAHDR